MEVAGIVIGGVGLAALFDSCMSTFEYIDVARKHGSDYQKAALKISVLELRLSRWGEQVHFSETLAEGPTAATTKQSKQVKAILGQIQADLDASRSTAERYALLEDEEDGQQVEEGSVTLESLGAKFRTLSLKRQKKTSLRKKTLWALRDNKRLTGLISSIASGVEDLENVFSALKQTSPQQRQAIIEDVEHLVLPAEVEEADEAEVSEPAIAVLQEITEGVDDQLRAAVNIAAQRAATGDSYRNVFTSDEAHARFGDFVAKGYTGPNYLNSSNRPTRHVDNVRTTGKARIQIGDSLGGKDVFDD